MYKRQALGYTKTLAEDRYLPTRSQFKDELAMLLGGRVAEELIFNEITTGSQNDIKVATELARRMVTDYGMSDKLGPRTFGDKQELVFLGREISEHKDYGDKIADVIDEEINKLMTEAYNVAKKILTDNREKLVQLAERLITKETLEGEELEAIFSEPAPPPEPEKKPEPAPQPVATRAKPKTRPARKKAPAVPGLLPKQSPATPD